MGECRSTDSTPAGMCLSKQANGCCSMDSRRGSCADWWKTIVGERVELYMDGWKEGLWKENHIFGQNSNYIFFNKVKGYLLKDVVLVLLRTGSVVDSHCKLLS